VAEGLPAAVGHPFPLALGCEIPDETELEVVPPQVLILGVALTQGGYLADHPQGLPLLGGALTGGSGFEDPLKVGEGAPVERGGHGSGASGIRPTSQGSPPGWLIRPRQLLQGF